MNHPELSEDLKMRILRTIEAHPAPTRATESLRAVYLNVIAILVSLCVYYSWGGVRIFGRAPALVLGTSMGSVLLATVGLAMLVDRNRTMLGRPRAWLLGAALLLPVALLAWKVEYSSLFPHALERWSTRIGYRCLTFSLGLGSLPLFSALYTRRGTDPVHPSAAGLAIGVAVGLSVAVFVDLWCPVAYLPHLLLGHILPIGLLAMIGFIVGKKWLSP
jgi:hypothetical protein